MDADNCTVAEYSGIVVITREPDLDESP